MKNSIYYLFFLTAPLLLFSCNEELSVTKKEQARMQEIIEQQTTCVASTVIDGIDTCGPKIDCSQDFCANNMCNNKIACCHRISLADFCDMTEDSSTSNRTFTAGEIQERVFAPGINCRTHIIRVRKRWWWWLQVRVIESDTTLKPLHTTVYYSIALLRGILAKNPVSFTFYRSRDLGNDEHIIPFKVQFQDRVEYYDISDSNP